MLVCSSDTVMVAAVVPCRFFVLNNEAGFLEYFVNEQSRPQKPRGMLPLAGAVISPSDEDSHTFTVNAISGEQYKLRGRWPSTLAGFSTPSRCFSARGRPPPPSIRFIQYWSGCFPLSAAGDAEAYRNRCWVRSSRSERKRVSLTCFFFFFRSHRCQREAALGEQAADLHAAPHRGHGEGKVVTAGVHMSSYQ